MKTISKKTLFVAAVATLLLAGPALAPEHFCAALPNARIRTEALLRQSNGQWGRRWNHGRSGLGPRRERTATNLFPSPGNTPWLATNDEAIVVA